MDRCALFVDASYALADGAMAVHGTRRRDSVSWNHAGLLTLLAGLAKDRTGLPVLRCYWYEAAVQDGRTAEQDALAEMPGLKLRLVNTRPGRREGIETQLRRDLVTLAKSGAIADAFIASADEHLAEIVSEVQDLGLRVVVLHISSDAGWTIPQPLRQECDDIVEISAVHLRPFVELVRGAEPAAIGEAYATGPRALPEGGQEPRAVTAAQQGAAGYAAVAAPAGTVAGMVLPAGAEYGQARQSYAGAHAGIGGHAPGAVAGQNGAAVPQNGAVAGQNGMAGMPHNGSGTAAGGQNGAAPDGAAQLGIPGAPAYGGPATNGAAPAPGYPAAGMHAAGMHAAGPYGLPGQNGLAGQNGNGMAPNGAGHNGYAPGSPQPAAGGFPNGAAPNGAAPNGAVHNGAGQNGAGHGGAGHGGAGQNGAGHGGAMQNGGYSAAPAGGGGYQNGGYPQGAYGSAAAPVGQPGYDAPAVPGQSQFYAAPVAGPFPNQPAGQGYDQSRPVQPGLVQPGLAQPGLAQPGLAQQGQPSQSGAMEVAPAYPQQGQYPGQPAASGVPALRAPAPMAVSLPDAVKAAHAEGYTFGESVGRGAPGLWLEAVLARKPRMPSDLEARLLQGSALPIDSLLHDEVRHSLRRGFWDALESARR